MNIQGWRSKEVEVDQLIKEHKIDVFGMAVAFLKSDCKVVQAVGVGRMGGGKASEGVGMLVWETLQP